MGRRKGLTLTNIPKYRTGRIFLFPLLLYLLLLYPVLGLMVLKSFPALKEKGRLELGKQSIENTNKKESGITFQITDEKQDNIRVVKSDGDSLTTTRVIPPDNSRKTSSALNNSISLLFRLVFLMSLVLGLAFNIPFKLYFRSKRKGKNIKRGLYKYCRQFLLKTPLINAGIVLLAFTIMHIVMLIQLRSPDSFGDELGRRLYTNYFFISLVASLLSVMFIYFWQKHLVHIKYIEHIYSREELQKRILVRIPEKSGTGCTSPAL